MPYNVTKWRTDALRDLEIPLRSLYDNEDLKRRGFTPQPPFFVEALDPGMSKVKIEGTGEGHVTGKISFAKDTLHIDDILVYGCGSGIFIREILIPALERGTGILWALLIWEGGETITQLHAKDGVVTETTIEL